MPLDSIQDALKAAVATRIASSDDAGEPSSDYSISPDRAWEALLEADLRRFEPRVADLARRLELDDLSTEVLWLCAAPELDEGYGRVFAYLLDSTARRLPTPRLIVSLLERSDADPEQVLARLGAAAPLRRLGCVRLIAGDGELPLVDQPISVADELTAFLLGTALHEEGADGRLLRRDLPAHPVGRPATLARIRAALAVPGSAPVLVGGPDAADMLAVAAGRGLVLLDARAAGEREQVSRASLLAALEDRALVLDRMRAARARRAGDLEGDDRVESRSRGPVRRHDRRRDATRGAGRDRRRGADADAGRAARCVGCARGRR